MGNDFYLRYRQACERAIRHVGRRYHLATADADDFAQEARLALLVRGDEIARRCRDVKRLDGYVYQTVLHVCSDWCRRNHVWRARLGGPVGGLAGLRSNPSEQVTGCSGDVNAAEAVLERLGTALAALRGEDRDLIESFYLRGVRLSILAAGLGTTPGALSVRLYRIRRQLREALAHGT